LDIAGLEEVHMKTNAALVVLQSLCLAPELPTAGAGAPLATQGLPAPPMPGPAHEIFKEDEGIWDVVMEVFLPMMRPMVTKGVSTNTLGCGGLCLISDLRTDLSAAVPFHGHSVTVYDSRKGKYTRCWTDSMSQGLELIEATWDAGARKLTSVVAGADAAGQAHARAVTDYASPDSRVFTLYGPEPDGKEAVRMRFTSTRRK
jgi:Protein of unknown function (DUF1579)